MRKNERYKIKTILLPWTVFNILYIVYYAIENNDIDKIKDTIFLMLKGTVRDALWPMGGSLWFLSCLFLISILSNIILKMKNRFLFLLICGSLNLLWITKFSGGNIFWNLDGVLQYMIFYCLGYLLFPRINYFLKEKNSAVGKIGKTVLIIGVVFYSAYLFVGNDLLGGLHYYASYFVRAFMGIALCFIVSYQLRNIKFLSDLGKNTLYFCGTEDIIKKLLPTVLALIGLELKFFNPIVIYLYVFVRLCFNHKFLVPCIKGVVQIFDGTKQKS